MGGECEETDDIITANDTVKRKRSIFSYEWLGARIVKRFIADAASKYGRGVVLDIGCGEKPYRDLFTLSPEYVGIEHPSSLHSIEEVDVFGSAECLPFRNGVFDTVVSFEVLEHLRDPKTALCEIERVLKTGGHCIVAVPFIFHLHEHPRDYFRFTPYGLEELFAAARLKVIDIRANSGFWVTSALLAVNYIEKFRQILMLRPVILLLIAFIQVTASGIEKIIQTFEGSDRVERFAFNYVAVARKQRE